MAQIAWAYIQSPGVRLILHLPTELWLGTYTLLEMERSSSGPEGPWRSLSDIYHEPAVLLTPELPDKLLLDGKSLVLGMQREGDVTINFSGGNPWTRATIAAQITGGGLQASVVGKQLRIETTMLGVDRLLEVKAGGAESELGLVVGEYGQGKYPYLPLVEERSAFYDPWGALYATHYRSRFRDVAGAVSGWSVPYSVAPQQRVDAAYLAVGTLQMVDGQGYTLEGQPVLFSALPGRPAGTSLFLPEKPFETRTDAEGKIAVTLVRGARYLVTIPLRGLHREILVPDKAQFDLLDPTVSTGPDAFAVVQQPLDFIQRRSV